MTTNHQRVTEGLDILTGVLAPYVAAELRARYADEWWDQGVLRVLYDDQKRNLPPGGEDDELIPALDAGRCLILIDAQWNDLFRRKLGREHRTWVKELGATRNKWAHKGLLDMQDEDAWRALDTMTRLVEHIDAEAVERLRALARIVRYGTEGPSTAAREAGDAREAGPGEEESRTGVLAAVPARGSGRGGRSPGRIPTWPRGGTDRPSSRPTCRRSRAARRTSNTRTRSSSSPAPI